MSNHIRNCRKHNVTRKREGKKKNNKIIIMKKRRGFFSKEKSFFFFFTFGFRFPTKKRNNYTVVTGPATSSKHPK